jgi:hypothetical protein
LQKEIKISEQNNKFYKDSCEDVEKLKQDLRKLIGPDPASCNRSPFPPSQISGVQIPQQELNPYIRSSELYNPSFTNRMFYGS